MPPPVALPDSATALFDKVAQSHSRDAIAHSLGLHPNTVSRWIQQRRVPAHYEGDFKRMLGRNGSVRVRSGDGVREMDLFYTRPSVARHCMAIFRSVARTLGVNLRSHRFVEPSAGRGAFLRLMPPTRRIGIDLKPRADLKSEIVRDDYLRWTPDDGPPIVVVGNPPFGLRGHLALQFINHSARYADLVAFILPQLFESDGKGVPAKRVATNLRLAHSERLEPNSFETPSGRPMNISTIFQVWTAVAHDRLPARQERTCREYATIYSLSDGGTPASTRNRHMIGRCDVYLPSTCFDGMQAYGSFEELPNARGYGIEILRRRCDVANLLRSHDWATTAFPSTNGALNLRRSLIEKVIVEGGFHDEHPERLPFPHPRRDSQGRCAVG